MPLKTSAWFRVWLVLREALLAHPDLRIQTFDDYHGVGWQVLTDDEDLVAFGTWPSRWLIDRIYMGGPTEAERYAAEMVAGLERKQALARSQVPA